MRFFSAARGLLTGLLFTNIGAAVPVDDQVEPRALGLLNTPLTRGLWTLGYNINTDYEQRIPPGRTVKYSWDITEQDQWLGPDGVTKDKIMLINNQFPGPVLEANWGDNVEVTIKNRLRLNGTSIHWHGIRMHNNNINDGVNGVTECPIPPGGQKTYKFRAEQYGTSWYHSHFSAQYGNGVVGSIVIHGPASANYDIDLGAYPITDYYYRSADNIVNDTLQLPPGPPPNSDNVLFNGKNINPAGPGGEYSKLTLKPKKKHLLRLINPSVEHNYQLSIVDHDMTIIATDFVPVKPKTVDNVFLGVGQRLDVIIEGNNPGRAGNFWMNLTLFADELGANANGCGRSNNPTPAAIVHYSNAKDELPQNPGVLPPFAECMDSIDYEPKVKRTVPTSSFTPALSNTLPVELDTSTGFVQWLVNSSNIMVEWDRPVLDYILDGNTSYPSTENLIQVDTPNTWTYWIINNLSGINHPMHLHGHDFYVLGNSATNAGVFSADQIPSLKTNNPTRRDTAMVPGGGWLALAFRSDNPGNWLFHCHIAWHIAGGLGVDFMERPLEQEALISASQRRQYESECAAWSSYWEASGLDMPDSGLRQKPDGDIAGV